MRVGNFLYIFPQMKAPLQLSLWLYQCKMTVFKIFYLLCKHITKGPFRCLWNWYLQLQPLNDQRLARVPAHLCVPTCPWSSIFPLHSAFPRSCTTFFSRSPVLHSECVGVGEQLITLTLCVYGWIRRAGSTRHRTTTPHVTRARCISLQSPTPQSSQPGSSLG